MENKKKGIRIFIAAIVIASIFAVIAPMSATEVLTDFRLGKVADKDAYNIGETINYTVTAENTWHLNYTTVTVKDTLPNGTEVTLGDCSGYFNVGEKKICNILYVMEKGDILTCTRPDGTTYPCVRNKVIAEGYDEKGNEMFSLQTETSEILVKPPVFNFTFNHVCCRKMEFNGSASYDEDGYIVNHTWNFSDGTFNHSEGAPGVISHTYDSCGRKMVTLSGYDDLNLFKKTPKIVYVPCPPRARAKANKTGVQSGAGEMVEFSCEGSHADPEAPGLTLIYNWTFSDGKNGSNDTECVTTRVVDGDPGKTVCATLTVSDSHCNDTDSQCVRIGAKPQVPTLTPIGIIALVSLLSIVAAMSISMKRRRRGKE